MSIVNNQPNTPALQQSGISADEPGGGHDLEFEGGFVFPKRPAVLPEPAADLSRTAAGATVPIAASRNPGTALFRKKALSG